MSVPRASVFIAVSVDGYIAREDGSLDWLHGHGESDEGDHGYADFMASIDTLVMGRKTFEKVLTFGAWPYSGKRVVVLSSGSPLVPEELESEIEVLALEPEALLRHLGSTGTESVYVDGGVTVQRFLRAGLVQELIVTRAPVLIGSGTPLFGSLPEDVRLEHVETRAFSNGLVQSRYRVLGAAELSSVHKSDEQARA
ncbi:MAG: dihydrofolate reductase family protein [Bacteroidota bacterium]